MRHLKPYQYLLAATAVSLLMPTSATAQVQELNVHRDTIPTYLKAQNKGIVNNALDVLNGNAAGVNVTSNGMDRMAQLSSVRVRGTTSIVGGNDPLVIIDGVTSDIATLSTIYPADIESFSVLKNAAETALYGSRGASGVIEVKTKRGTGKGFQISYETNIGLEAMSKKLDMLSAFGSYSYTSNENSEFCPTWLWAQGNVYRGEFKKQEYLGNVSLDYAHTWGIHSLSAGFSTEYHYLERTAFWTRAKGITTNEFGYDNIGVTASRPYGATGSIYEDQSLASVMANASYTLYNKYKLTLTMRGDGSSMVGDDHTWGFFPSVSAEWDIKKERFLSGFDGISTLKLRTGYGRSGNLGGISAYTTMSNVQQTGIVPVNNTPTVTLGTIRNNNPDLKWETKSTFNIGGEIGLWHNRLMLTAEYYYSKTTDMLYSYDVPVPPFAYDKLLANIGAMSNQGLEIGFSIAPVQTKDIDLNVSMNLSFQKNKLLSLSGNYNGMNMSAANITAIGSIDGAGQNGGDNNHVLYQIVGQPLGVFYLPHCTGLYKDEQGTMKYRIEDLDRNGTIDFGDGGDRRICGQATPKATLGSNISLRYKNFYMSLQMNGAFGHKIFNGTALAYNNMSSFPIYNVIKGAPERNIVDQNVSDYWLERGDYLNFEYLTVGYNVPVKSNIVRSLRVSCSVNNLATITSYSGLTPMINSYVVNSSMGIDDKRCYPTYRTYSIGVSVQF